MNLLEKYKVYISKKGNLFLVFLVSYLIILIIPVLIGSLSYIQSVRILKEQIGNYNLSMLGQASQVIDGYLYSIDQLITSISTNPDIQNFQYARKPLNFDDYYNMKKAVDELSKYKSSNSFVNNIYVYCKRSDLILSYAGKYDPESFYGNYLTSKENSFNEWKSELDSISIYNKQYFPVQPAKDKLTSVSILSCRQSLPLGEKNDSIGVAEVMIDANKIENLLHNIDELNMSDVFIMSNSGQTLMQVGNGKYTYQELLSIQNSGKENYFSKIGGEQVLVSHVTSSYNNWEYITILPTKFFMGKVNDIKILTFFIVLLELIIGCIFSFWLAKRNYRPIKQITDNIIKKTGINNLHKSNELAFIEEISISTLTENDRIKEEMAKQQPMAKANILMQLLNGNIILDKNISNSLKALGIEFSGEGFSVMLVHIDDCSEFKLESTLDKMSLVRFIITNVGMELIETNYIAYSIDMNLNDVCFIIDAGKSDSLLGEKMYEAANKLNLFMIEKFSIFITVGLSSLHKNINGISLSYNESVQAMEYKIIRGKGSVISYNEISNTSKGYFYPANLETHLVNYIKVGDIENAMALLDEIFNKNYKDNSLSIDMAKCLFFDIMSTALKVINDIDIDYEVIFEKDSNPIEKILSCRTADEMYDVLKFVYKTICEYIVLNMKSHNDQLKYTIIDYIGAKYNDSSLSLTSVAGSLNINPSYLSSFFKKHTGENFVDYLNKIRVEKARELLKTTSLSIQDISDKVGYTSYASLIRIYKKFYGITPGKYREQSVSSDINKV